MQGNGQWETKRIRSSGIRNLKATQSQIEKTKPVSSEDNEMADSDSEGFYPPVQEYFQEYDSQLTAAANVRPIPDVRDQRLVVFEYPQVSIEETGPSPENPLCTHQTQLNQQEQAFVSSPD